MALVEYKVVREEYIHELEESVDEYLKKGWKPVGGATVRFNAYMQTLVREDNNND
ncbi:DUF1737 domain-containing protein [Streptomyces sp. TRM76323]|uniref:DUF1737 domain-containing protein n=1 Tax=Streptomyces tamarix TaxID=3078565 RepID=A0ABU3QLF6_9ACTN|nr:DUF1737 domain-containing protein [Streptomyces tamarix]MDT9683456.1 DUF1737 domain-containing protein [Streptomyces tamarix]